MGVVLCSQVCRAGPARAIRSRPASWTQSRPPVCNTNEGLHFSKSKFICEADPEIADRRSGATISNICRDVHET